MKHMDKGYRKVAVIMAGGRGRTAERARCLAIH